jgi:hypothetical protein
MSRVQAPRQLPEDVERLVLGETNRPFGGHGRSLASEQASGLQQELTTQSGRSGGSAQRQDETDPTQQDRLLAKCLQITSKLR